MKTYLRTLALLAGTLHTTTTALFRRALTLLLLAFGLLAGGLHAASPIKLYMTHGSNTTSADRLDKVDIDGTNSSTVLSDAANFGQPEDIQIDYANGYIFMADGNTGSKILRFNLDGTGRQVIFTVTHTGPPRGLALDRDNQKIYFTTASATSADDRITRINYDGSGEMTIASGAVSSNDIVVQPLGIAVDTERGYIYVGDSFANQASNLGIVRFNLDGSGRTQIVSEQNATFGGVIVLFQHLTVDESTGQLYFCTGSGTSSNDRVMRVNSDGSGLTTIYSDAANFNQPLGIGIDKANGYVFVGDTPSGAAGTAYRFNLDGSGGRIQVGLGGAVGSVVNGFAVYSANAPTISHTTNQTISVGGSTGSLTVTVGDVETPVGNLLVYAKSSNQTLVPNGNIVIGGSGANRTVTVTGAAGQSGSSTITLTVNDGARITRDTFTVTAAAAPAPTVTNVTSDTANGSYKAGVVIPVTVTFSASVTVTGTPTLALNSGGSATYASGSPGTTLTFNYTVGAGQTAADLDYATTNSLALAGGTINATSGGAAATLTLPATGGAGSLGGNKAIVIDTTAPTVSIGAPSSGSIAAGAGSVTYTVTYADTNFSASTLANGNITLNSTGGASGTIGVSGSGNTRTVTISSITGAGTLGITIAAATATDTAGNTAPAAGPSTTFNVIPAPEPDILVTQASAVADGGSVDFGNVTAGSPSTAKTFTITNPGTANLTTLAVTGGTSEFAVSALSATTVTPGGAGATFTVTFTPSATGARTATLQITSNVTGAKNPYDIVLDGTGDPIAQTIDFTLPTSALTTDTVPLSATGGGSGQPVTFSVFSGPGSISGNSLTFTGAGPVVVRASQAGNGNYAAAADVDRTITASLASQAITFGPLGGKTFGDAPFAVNATGGGSGNPVSFSIFSGPATIVGNTVTITGAGAVVVRASQLGNALYADATPVDQGFTVAQAGQTIDFTLPTTALLTDTVSLSATGGGSGQPVTFSVFSGPGSISGNSLTFTGPGAVVVQASQAGNGNYLAAPNVDRTITATAGGDIAVDLYGPRVDGVGAPVDFGTVTVGSSQSLTAVVSNTGTADLVVTSITAPAGFRVPTGSQQQQQQASGSGGSGGSSGAVLPRTIAPGGTAFFDVFFEPTGAGTFSGDVVIVSDDADEGSFEVAVTGVGAVPEITVDLNGARTDGATVPVNLGSTPVGGSLQFVMIVANPSAVAPLTISGISVPAGYRVPAGSASPGSSGGSASSSGGNQQNSFPVTIAPGGTRFFDVYFEPTASGTYAGDIVIASNAVAPADEFSFAVRANGGFDQQFFGPLGNVTVDVLRGRPGHVLLSVGGATGGTVKIVNGKVVFKRTSLASEGSFTFTARDSSGQTYTETVGVYASPAAGAYVGLLTDGTGKVRGRIDVTLNAAGACTGTVWTDGARRPFWGPVFGNGAIVTYGFRTGGLLLLLPGADYGAYTPDLVASIGAPIFATTLTGTLKRSPYTASNLAPEVGRYTLVGNRVSPTGPRTGLAFTCSITNRGLTSFAGKLGDGTNVTQGGPLLTGGRLPFYFAKGTGAALQRMWGDIVFDRTASPIVSGSVHWSIPSGVTSKVPLSTGLEQDYTILGAPYTPAGVGSQMLTLGPSGRAKLTLDLPSLYANPKSLTLSLGNGPIRAGNVQWTVLAGTIGNLGRMYLGLNAGTYAGFFLGPRNVHRDFFGVVLQGESLNYGQGFVIDLQTLGNADLNSATPIAPPQ